ncbi:MAG: AraC family transcriptional regulator [Cyanobacteria bacterium J06554_3]
MSLLLTRSDFQDLEYQAQAGGEQIYQSLGLENRHNLPAQLGDGGDRIFNLRDGLSLYIRKATLNQPIHLLEQHESRFPLIAKFYLSGMSRVQTPNAPDIDNDYAEIAGHHYLYHLPNHTETEEWPANQLIHVVMILADARYLSSFAGAQSVSPVLLRNLLKGDITQRFHQPLGKMTPHIRQLVQILVQGTMQCPYDGLMQQLYLESKALELLAAQFATWSEQPSRTRAATAPMLSKSDMAQLHQARAILIEQVKQPPSLNELARRVNLNQRKLNRGFRQLFGTTVFGYLQAYRLQQAKTLLQANDLTIAAVATTVGYRNPEAFSTAFRRKFAVSPKAYQLSLRR